MRKISLLLTLFACIFCTSTTMAQNTNTQTTHKVQKSETINGIANRYGITPQALRDANPRMRDMNYVLKADEVIVIPAKPKEQTVAKPKEQTVTKPQPAATTTAAKPAAQTPAAKPAPAPAQTQQKVETKPQANSGALTKEQVKAAKDAEKARKEAEKAEKKAQKEAEKAAKKAQKEAEKNGQKPSTAAPQTPVKPQEPAPTLVAQGKTITLGVLLPLHYENGDGKRMLEYYRGMLMAANDLKKEGYNLDINAWNIEEGEDIRITLLNDKVKKCDIIFGPLYTTQVHDLAEYCKNNSIKMVVPFSINGEEIMTQPQMYQVYQTAADQVQQSIFSYMQKFTNANTIIINCEDNSTNKADFTNGLKEHLQETGRALRISSLSTPAEDFQKAFSRTQPNVVILNSGKYAALTAAYEKLDELKKTYPELQISMYGYNDWYLYVKKCEQKMREYDTYIPACYNYNPQTERMQLLDNRYEEYYKTDMIGAIPRFAVTGYDQMMFWMHGINKYGKNFNGTKDQIIDYTPVQTNYQFERIPGGGYQNRHFVLAHFH